jgi:hypothetical protein
MVVWKTLKMTTFVWYDYLVKDHNLKMAGVGDILENRAFHDFAKKVLKEFAREKFTNEHVLLSRNHQHRKSRPHHQSETPGPVPTHATSTTS